MIKIRPDVIKIKDPESGNYTSLLAIKGEKGDRGENGNVFAYPVGAIYMSVDPTSPSELFGGTWERLKDSFLLGASDTYAVGSTGGSADAVLIEHYHEVKTRGGLSASDITAGYGAIVETASGTNTAQQTTKTGTSAGEKGKGQNMPPYLAVYMWKRIA